jgi:hypothetical protein
LPAAAEADMTMREGAARARRAERRAEESGGGQRGPTM